MEKENIKPAETNWLSPVHSMHHGSVVFKAFTEAEHLAHWWGPKGF